ncbi:MAG: hypothetical protein JWO27_2383 [Frankiales bacterium]|nr:hypothetical protein [Frankiales bacterium]MCW2706726.1 hypothetical protein [Frankiales bacterium]
MDTTEHYGRVADDFGRVVDGVSDWTAGTPCEEWDARRLATHVVDTHRRVLARLDGSEAPVLGPDADPRAEWSRVRADLEQALRDHGDQEVDSFGSLAPFSTVVDTLLCADTLLHTWDLARATGQDETLDLASVSKAHAFLTPLGDMMRQPGGFGPAVTLGDDASAQEQLLAFAGREPRAATS